MPELVLTFVSYTTSWDTTRGGADGHRNRPFRSEIPKPLICAGVNSTALFGITDLPKRLF